MTSSRCQRHRPWLDAGIAVPGSARADQAEKGQIPDNRGDDAPYTRRDGLPQDFWANVVFRVRAQPRWGSALGAGELSEKAECIVENRRRLHRQPAGWLGSCKLAGDTAAGWRDCRVIDISMLGLGITFDYPDPGDLSGRLISVNLPGDASSVNVRLEGEIKNVAPMINRGVRVGIEFVPLSETELAITSVLSVMTDVLVKS